MGGRETKKQATTRPDSVIPEVWQDFKKKARLEEIELWKTEGPRRQKARDKRAAEAKRPNFIEIPLTER